MTARVYKIKISDDAIEAAAVQRYINDRFCLTGYRPDGCRGRRDLPVPRQLKTLEDELAQIGGKKEAVRAQDEGRFARVEGKAELEEKQNKEKAGRCKP